MSPRPRRRGKKKGKAGRPTKLTAQTIATILGHIEGGNFRSVAAEAAGVRERTMALWMAKGEAAERGPYRDFYMAVLKAERAAEITALGHVMAAAAADPKHAEWFLERKFPERWGRKDRHEHTGKDGGPIQWDMTRYTDDELAQMERLHLKGQGKA